jgi:hypothetical protein
MADECRYVINSEAAKALYKTMAGRTTSQPKDLSREWHSDGKYPIIHNFHQLTEMISNI